MKEADKLFLKDGKTSSENFSYLFSIPPPDLMEHAETVFPLDGKLSIHLTDFQFLQQSEMIPLGVDEADGDIPQLDGNDTSGDDSNEELSIVGLTENEIYARDPALILSGYSFEDINPIKATTVTTKMSNFVLNKEKQMENLAGDAKLSDFKIKINDDDKNVSIQCSTAFYDAVAKPVLCGLNQGTILTVGNIPIHCNHIDHNRDSSGYEYNRVLHIILGGGAQPNIGKVTVHLHHTKRHVQMQGSAKMPDGNFAPVWFLNSFIKDRFVSLAKLKHYDITAINKMVKAIFENTKESVRGSKNCCQCSRQFSSNSRPTKCIYCNQLFHKTNCLPAHSSACKSKYPTAPFVFSALSTPATAPGPMSTSLQQNSIESYSPSTQNNTKRKRFFTPALSSFALQPSVSSTGTANDPNDVSPSQLNVQAPVFISSHNSDLPFTSVSNCTPFISLSNSAPSATSTLNSIPPITSSSNPTNKKRAKAKTVTITPEQAKIDYLNLELNSAKTRIAQLDSFINNHEATIKNKGYRTEPTQHSKH